jgi:MFS family permease
MITLGTGTGTGAMIGGTLLCGKHFQAGNQGGHSPILFNGRNCTCGANYALLLDFPVLLGAILLLRWLHPPGHFRGSRRVEKGDFWGAGFLIVAFVALQISTSRGERDLWFESPFLTTFFVLSLLGFALFLWWDSRPDNGTPVLHLRHVFQLPPLRNAVLSATIVGAILGAGLYVMPPYLRTVQDYSAMQTGEFFSLFGIGYGTGAVLTLRVFVPACLRHSGNDSARRDFHGVRLFLDAEHSLRCYRRYARFSGTFAGAGRNRRCRLGRGPVEAERHLGGRHDVFLRPPVRQYLPLDCGDDPFRSEDDTSFFAVAGCCEPVGPDHARSAGAQSNPLAAG